MKFYNKFAFAALSAAMIAGFVACDDDDDNEKSSDSSLKYYATTNMTWAEFYAGELGKSASVLSASGYDGVTAATKSKPSMFSSCIVEDSVNILGVKNVNVAMSETVYKSLSDADKQRFTFYTDTVFSQYKKLNSDGSFDKMVSPVSSQNPSSVSLTCGYDARWDQYVIDLSGLDLSEIKDSSSNVGCLMGALLTTTDGSVYGLKPLYNLWLNTAEFGFSVSAFSEVHGYSVGYEHTSSLEGKTVKNLTYILRDKSNISIDMNVFVKLSTDASVAVDGSVAAGTDVNVNLVMSKLPSDSDFKLTAVKSGSGRAAKTLTADQYSYSDGVLTLNGEVAAGTYTVSFTDDKYVNIGTSFTVE